MASMMQLTEIEPGYKANGVVWIKPSISQAFMYLNGAWRPFAGGERIFTYSVPLTVFIRGIDRTANCYIRTCSKIDIIYEKVDTMTIEIDDIKNEIELREGDEIIVFRKATESETPTIWFAGLVDKTTPREIYSGSSKFIYSADCVDYTKWLSKKLAVEKYTNQTLDAILNDLLTDYAVEFHKDTIPASPTLASKTFDYRYVGDCVQELANDTNYSWYIDYNKKLNFFKINDISAPYKLTESLLTTGHYRDLTIEVNKTQLRNRIYVKGGVYLSTMYTQEFLADGTQRSFRLNYPPRNPIYVYVDTGSGYGPAKTLAIDTPNASVADFVVNVTYAFIANLDYATLSAGHKLKVTYFYDVQVLTQDDDLASQEEMREIEGGDGIYSFLLSDTKITTIEEAHTRALQELTKYGTPIVQGSFITDQDGYRSGQTLTLEMPSWGFPNNQYMIQKVQSQLQGSNKFFYKVDFATP